MEVTDICNGGRGSVTENKSEIMNYGQARNSVRTGHCIQRPIWGNSFVFERPVSHIDATTIPAIKSLPQMAREAISKIVPAEDSVRFESHLCLFRKETKGASYLVENQWTPSAEDLEAEDWIVYNP